MGEKRKIPNNLAKNRKINEEEDNTGITCPNCGRVWASSELSTDENDNIICPSCGNFIVLGTQESEDDDQYSEDDDNYNVAEDSEVPQEENEEEENSYDEEDSCDEEEEPEYEEDDSYDEEEEPEYEEDDSYDEEEEPEYEEDDSYDEEDEPEYEEDDSYDEEDEPEYEEDDSYDEEEEPEYEEDDSYDEEDEFEDDETSYDEEDEFEDDDSYEEENEYDEEEDEFDCTVDNYKDDYDFDSNGLLDDNSQFESLDTNFLNDGLGKNWDKNWGLDSVENSLDGSNPAKLNSKKYTCTNGDCDFKGYLYDLVNSDGVYICPKCGNVFKGISVSKNESKVIKKLYKRLKKYESVAKINKMMSSNIKKKRPNYEQMKNSLKVSYFKKLEKLNAPDNIYAFLNQGKFEKVEKYINKHKRH